MFIINKYKLYRSGERIQGVDKDPLRSFDNILDKESSPFHEELYINFMRDTYNIEFTDSMHFEENGMQYALHNLSKSMKSAMMLLCNSRQGIYTDISGLSPRISNYISTFDEFDLLFAYNVCSGKAHPVPTYVTPLVVENFPFRGSYISVVVSHNKYPDDAELIYKVGDWFKLYKSTLGYFSNSNFFTRYTYDWKRDLPDIKSIIDFHYRDYKVFDTYTKKCTLYDLVGIDEKFKSYNTINHMLSTIRYKADNRKIAQLFFVYMQDGSIELYHQVSVKYPQLHELLVEPKGFECNMEKAFCLFVDVDEMIRGVDDFLQTWFGAYFYKDSIELFDKDSALIEFSKQIPMVLRDMKIPIKGDNEFREVYFKI